MERLNKKTLAHELSRPQKPMPIYLSITSSGLMGMSKGLFDLMRQPEYIEFFKDDKELWIARSTPEDGFKVTVNRKASGFTFRCKPVAEKYFNLEKQRAVVFTESTEFKLDGMPVLGYCIKTPALSK